MPEISEPHKDSHQNGGWDEISVAGLSGALADDQPVKSHGAAKHDATVYDTIAKLTGAQFCRIKTGTYTGDGSTSQAITGVGFRPKFVWIFENPAVETASQGSFVVPDSLTAGLAQVIHRDNTDEVDNRVDSLDADGFTVDDDGIDEDPNKNGANYCYIAFG